MQRIHAAHDEGGVTLSRILLERHYAHPALWFEAERDPATFLDLFLQRWTDAHTPHDLGGIELSATLQGCDPHFRDPTFYLTLDVAGYHAPTFLHLGPALQRMDIEVPGLAHAFYHRLISAVHRWLRVFDYRDAQTMWARLVDRYHDENEREHVEGLQPVTPFPFQDQGVDLLHPALGESTLTDRWCRRLIADLLEIERVSYAADPLDPRLFMEQAHDEPVAVLVASLEPNDPIHAYWDHEAEDGQEGVLEPPFNILIPFDATNPAEVADALHLYATACRTASALARLVHTYHQPDEPNNDSPCTQPQRA